MDELVFCFLIESVRVSSVGGFGEVERFLFGELRLFEVVETIVGQETPVDVMDVRVATGSVGFVVDYFALNGN